LPLRTGDVDGYLYLTKSIPSILQIPACDENKIVQNRKSPGWRATNYDARDFLVDINVFMIDGISVIVSSPVIPDRR
jgi:hypothetical protein